MKTICRHFIPLVLVIALLLTGLPVFASAEYYPPVDDAETSIVDALKSIGEDSSFSNRERIAAENGISNYEGTADQNIYLLELLKVGKLVIPGSNDNEYEAEIEQWGYSSPSGDTLLLGYVEPSHEMVEATEKTTLRSGPKKSTTAICTVIPGDCFTMAGDPVTNEYGNVWYPVSFAGAVVFIFSGRVVPHTHYYTQLGSSGMSICKCGACSSADHYASQIDAGAIALDPSIFGNPDALTAAVAVLGAAGTAAAAAAPYVVLVVGTGTLFYIMISASGSQVLDSYELRTAEDCERRFQEDGYGIYYKAVPIPGSGALLIGISDSDRMDLPEANRFLKNVVDGQCSPSAIASDLTRSARESVWTYSQDAAVALCERFDALGSRYGYGTSTGYDCYYECNRGADNYYLTGYYRHFHLYYQPYFTSWMKKADDTHVFFGLPATEGETF